MNNKLVVAEKAPETLPVEYGSESLAVRLTRAEVDQQITTARAYPRSISRAIERILTLATLDEKAAASCIYALPRGKDETGQKKIIKGPSIRLAEIIASQWGNCRDGARVVHVDRFEKFVEAEGIFHDLETNRITTKRRRRRISDKHGRLYTEDMIVVTGNAACSIALREAILGGVPRGVWSKAYEAAEAIATGDIKTLVSRRRSAIATMAGEYGITADQIFAALEIGGEEDMDLEQLSILTAMRSSLKNGEASVDELFPKPQSKDAPPKSLNDKLDKIAAGGNGNGEQPRDPPHDPETGEIIGQNVVGANVVGDNIVSADDVRRDHEARIEALNDPTGDLGTQRLIDDARAKTKEGALKFKYWVAKLSKTNFEKLAPYLDKLRDEANAVDAAKVTNS